MKKDKTVIYYKCDNCRYPYCIKQITGNKVLVNEQEGQGWNLGRGCVDAKWKKITLEELVLEQL